VGAPGRAPEEFGDQLDRWQSFGQRMAMTSVRAEDRVVRAQMRAYARGYGFLAHVGVTSAMHQAACVHARELLFGSPNQLHRAV
jgi:hypothetical protein